MRKEFIIPIYNVRLCVIVGETMRQALAVAADFYGDDASEYEEFAIAGGLACNHNSNFAVVFSRKHLDMNIMSHEVFHTTHRMLDWINANFDKDHHETAASLHGYLMDLVFKTVKRYMKK